MNPTEQAILQDEIRQALNALFKSGQVGRVEKTEIVVFPKTTITLEVETSGGTSRGSYQSNDGFPMTVGNTYKVYWNGKAYSLTCRLMANSEDNGNIIEYRIIGNSGGAMGVADTGEPFGIVEIFTNDNVSVLMVISFSDNESATLSVSEFTETIHPIDLKFIPAETPDAEILESYQTFTKHYVAEGEAPDNVQWKEYYDPVMVFIDTEIPADRTHVSLSGLDVAKLEQLQTAPVPICFTMDNGYSHTVMPVFTVVLADGFMSYSCQYALTSRVIFQRNPNGTWEAYKQ